MEEPSYAALQREVQRKLGRCLIRIQQYELLLREIVAKREVSAVLGSSPEQPPASAIAGPMTMGQLVGVLTDKYFQPTLLESGQTEPDAESEDEEHPVGWARIRISVSMPPDAHAQLKAELQELVDLRNDLVHHFVEGQDLFSEQGCIAAEMYLQDCYAEVDRHFASLQGWAASMNSTNRSLAAFMESPEYEEFFLAELSPFISQRHAALPELIKLLRRAESDQASDGWTALSAAVAFIGKIAPDETPGKHTFGSWRHVLHEARVFEVRKVPAQPGGAAGMWFRSVRGAS